MIFHTDFRCQKPVTQVSKRKLSLEVVKRLQCQKNVKIEGKKRTLKTVQKREKRFTKGANLRKWPQKYAKTKIHVKK